MNIRHNRPTFLVLHLIMLASALPLVMFPRDSFLLPLLLLLPAIILSHRLYSGQWWPATAFNLPLLLMCLMLAVSLAITFDIGVSFGKILGVAYGMLLFAGVVSFTLRRKAGLWLCLVALALTSTGMGIIGLLGAEFPQRAAFLNVIADRLPAALFSLPGAESGFNPNQVAGVLLWAAPLMLVLTGAGLEWRRRRPAGANSPPYALAGQVASGFIALFLALVVALTQSRGGLLGLGFGVGLALFLWLFNQRRRLAVILLPILFLAGATAFFLVFQDSLLNGQGAFPQDTQVTGEVIASSGSINTLEGRMEIWSRAVYGIQDFPFTGMGIGVFREVVPVLYPLFRISPATDIAHAHNMWLQAGLDLGIVGLIAYGATGILALAMMLQVWLFGESFWLRALALGCLASLGGSFVYGLFDTVALGAKPGFIFWLLLGIVAAIHRQFLLDQDPAAARKPA